ncbi:glycosyltransferase [Brucella sp. BE17]|uniref:glycosyltransferase family 2 protein n=1 Tax=Brucella sp. BE17 TaxID=3142977 RepID=UPI0031BBC891
MQNARILVSIVTRNRPIMLKELLHSLTNIALPASTKVDFLVVENHSSKTLSGCIDTFASGMSESKVVYLLEVRIGISYSRNCALTYAIANDYDFLVFIDDDERAEPEWLIKLFSEQQRGNLDIVGSPVWPKPEQCTLSFWQKFVWSGIQQLSEYGELKTRRKCERGAADTIKVATGSWMGKLTFFRQTGLRFDTGLNLTGGEDWHLWTEAKSKGAKSGWAPDATVYETVPLCRLTLTYHFRRNRDHEATKFLIAYKANPRRAITGLPAKLASRLWKLTVSVLSLPIKGPSAAISATMALGGIVGQIQGFIGKQSAHYKYTTGH